jgi:perosamine synthetase
MAHDVSKVIPQFQPYLDHAELQAVKECFDANWITEGPKSKEFVTKLSKVLNFRYGVLASNGTVALYMGLIAMGIKPGDEVIVPDFTFIASANAITMCGAKPIFCDIDETLHIDLKKAKKLITRKTRAIMPVHIYGMACDMESVMQFANSNGIKVIEDAAQAVGVTWNGKQAGTFGDIGTFSFFADKTITTGEGGLVVTNNPETYEKLQYLRNQGRIDRGSFVHPEIGYNFRMTDLQSAIGLAQLEKLAEIIEKKKKILNHYAKSLSSEINLTKPSENSKSGHIPFRVCFRVKGGSQPLLKFLAESNIETRTFFYPLHSQPSYIKKYNRITNRVAKTNFSVSDKMFDEGVCLPSWVEISEEEIEYICEKINEFLLR